MKKIFSLTILFVVSSTMMALAYFYFDGSYDSKGMASQLSGHNWRFYSLVSEDADTGHYVSTIYQGAEYNFAADNTYSGNFFGMTISGTWELDDDILILNKNTSKEEAYMISSPSSKSFVIKTTEKGKEVSLQFVKL